MCYLEFSGHGDGDDHGGDSSVKAVWASGCGDSLRRESSFSRILRALFDLLVGVSSVCEERLRTFLGGVGLGVEEELLWCGF